MTSDDGGIKGATGDFPGTHISEKYHSDTQVPQPVGSITRPVSSLTFVIALEGESPPTEKYTEEVASTENKTTRSYGTCIKEDVNPF